jgi:hypothetical protein
MNVDILSDKFTEAAQAHSDFIDEPPGEGDISIKKWDETEVVARDRDVIVLDLDFSDRVSEDSIPLLQGGRRIIGNRFQNLQGTVAAFLEEGGVIIVLLSERTSLAFNKSTDSLAWLDHLGSTTLLKHEPPRSQFDVKSTIPSVNDYFTTVDLYQFTIRFEEGVVTNPEILAQHSLDNEPVAVSFNEYIDPNGIPRTTFGRVVLLPQPTRWYDNFKEVVDSLAGIGRHYLRRRNTATVLDQIDMISIDDLVAEGESEILEFKAEWPESSTQVAKEIVAFANTWGGALLFGIEDDQTICGISDIDGLKNRIAGVCHQNIDPSIDVSTDIRSTDDGDVLIVNVPRGPEQPYSTEDRIYRRKGPTSVAIPGSEVSKYFA